MSSIPRPTPLPPKKRNERPSGDSERASEVENSIAHGRGNLQDVVAIIGGLSPRLAVATRYELVLLMFHTLNSTVRSINSSSRRSFVVY